MAAKVTQPQRRFVRRSMRTGSTTHTDRSGVAATEMALLLPLLLLIVIGCIDFGRFAHSYLAATNAAREGASFGMLHPTTAGSLSQWEAAIDQAVEEEIEQTLSTHGLTDEEVTTVATRTVEGGNPGSPWRVAVTVTIPFKSITTFPMLPQNITLSRTVVMRGIR